MKNLLVSACIAATLSIPSIAWAQDQYAPPPPAQYPYPPPAPGQYAPPPAQYQYPPPAQYGYPYPPPQAYAEPVAPAGAVWVGPPGECLYAAGAVYWCAQGVIFPGFPAGWDFARYPVVNIAPGIVIDPIWYGGWRRSHPGFVFRGRIATEGERRDFVAHREEIRNRARPPQRGGRPEDRRDDRRDR